MAAAWFDRDIDIAAPCQSAQGIGANRKGIEDGRDRTGRGPKCSAASQITLKEVCVCAVGAFFVVVDAGQPL